MFRRMISGILVLVLVLQSFPMTARSEEIPPEESLPETIPVAETTLPATRATEWEEPLEETTQPAFSEEESIPWEPTISDPDQWEEIPSSCVHGLENCPVCQINTDIDALPTVEEARQLPEEEQALLAEEVCQILAFHDCHLTLEQQQLVEDRQKLKDLSALLDILWDGLNQITTDAAVGVLPIGEKITLEGGLAYPSISPYRNLTRQWAWSVNADAGVVKVTPHENSRYITLTALSPGKVNITYKCEMTYYANNRSHRESKFAGLGTYTVKAPTVVVSFNRNNGTGTANPVTLTEGKYGTLPNVQRKGYNFEGWYYNNTRYRSGDTLAVYKDHTLTAWWAQQGTLKLDSEGGTPSSYTLDISLHRSIGNILPSPTRPGYAFAGWYSKDGSKITKNTSFSVSGDTIYARWKKLHTITLDVQGGTLPDGEATSFQRAVGTTYPSLPKPVRQNYIFTGWALKDGTAIKSYDTVQLDQNHSLYAQWQYFPWSLKNGVLTVGGNGPMFDPGKVSDLPWYPYRSEIKSVVIDTGLTSLVKSTFYQYPALTSVSIYADLTQLPESIFEGCTSLKTVTLPDSLQVIGESAFEGCTSLEKVNFPQSLQTIGLSAFNQCRRLKEVHFPEGLATIQGGAFQGCTSLTKLDLPDGLLSIGLKGFYGCTGLTELWIPADTAIESDTFSYCSNVRKVTAMPKQARNALATGNKSIHLVIMEGASAIDNLSGKVCMESITLPSTLKTIGKGAFTNCTGLKTIVIPDGVTSLGAQAFQGCDKLASVTIGSGVGSISEKAFYDCGALTKVVIREGVQEIGVSAFSLCKKLQRIVVPDSVTKIDEAAFLRCSTLGFVSLGKNLKTIGEIAFGSCTPLSGMAIPAGVTSIGAEAFAGCNRNFSISFLGRIPSIGAYAFDGLYVYAQYPSNYSSGAGGTYGASSCKWYSYDGSHTCQWGSGSIWRQPTCAVPGEKVYECRICQKTKTEILTTAHRTVTTAGYEPTCTQKGLTDGISCQDCGTILQIQAVVPATGHTVQRIAGTAATCTRDGKTEGQVCTVCRETLQSQSIIPALGHDPLLVDNIPAKCETDGYTGDRVCTRCEAVTQEGSVIPATGHSYIWKNNREPSCTAPGNTGHQECSSCGLLHPENSQDQVLDALGHSHTLRRIPAQPATDTQYGHKTLVVNGCIRCNLWFTDETCQHIMSRAEKEAFKQLPENIVYAEAREVTVLHAASNDTVPGSVDMGSYPDGMQLTASVSPATARQEITWSSSNQRIATVDQTGLVTFLTPGTVTITAKGPDKVSKKVTISAIHMVQSLEVVSGTGFPAAALGLSIPMEVRVTPAHATNQNVIWSVNDDNLATISKNGILTINDHINLEEADVLWVYAQAADGSGVVAEEMVYLFQPTQEITLTAEDSYKGAVLNITGYPETAAGVYTVTSSNPDVVEVEDPLVNNMLLDSADGFASVRFKDVGTATITVSAADGSGEKASYTFYSGVTWITIGGAGYRRIAEGCSIPLKAHVEPENAGDSVYWAVDDPSVASISQDGVLTAYPGTAGKTFHVIVTATDGSNYQRSDKFTIQKPLEELIFTKADGTPLREGDTIVLDPCDPETGAQEGDFCWQEVTFQMIPEDRNRKIVAEVENPAIGFWDQDFDGYDEDWYWNYIQSGSFGSYNTAGRTKVTLKSEDGSPYRISFYIKVKGQDISSVSLPQDLKVLGGQSLTITPQILPENASQKELEWSVSDEPGVSISSEGVLTTAPVYAPTQVTVTAKTKDGTNLKASCQVTIYPMAVGLRILYQDLPVSSKTVLPLGIASESPMILTAGPIPDGASTDVRWSSSNEAIATVEKLADGTCRVTARKLGTATITAVTLDGSNKTASVKVKTFHPLTGLSLQDQDLAGGKSLKLIPDFQPANATDQSVTWSVQTPPDNPKVASITTKGQLKTKTVTAPTDVTVTAVSRENPAIRASCIVTLYPQAKKVTLYQSGSTEPMATKHTLSIDSLLLLRAEVAGKTPDVPVSQSIVWTSSKPTVAKVYPNGMVLPVSPGTATITAMVNDGTKKKDTVKITVVQMMEQLEITGPQGVGSGKKITLKALASPENTTSKAVTWSVNNPAAASISSKGVLTAKKKLTVPTPVTITATAKDGSGVRATYDILVYPLATGIQLEYYGRPVTSKTLSLAVGDALDLDTLIQPVNAFQGVTWKSSKTSVATVDENGNVKALKAGSATITATCADGSKRKVSIKIVVK